MTSFNHSFSVDLAVELGSIELAILVHHFQYWIRHNQKLKRNLKDNKTWMYQTHKEIIAHFPYWTVDQVRRYIDQLIEKEILIKGNYNKSGFDKTIWYAFKNEERFTIGKLANGDGESAKSTGESAKPIPDPIPDPIPEEVVCSAIAQEKDFCDVKSIEKTHIDGSKLVISQGDIFRLAIQEKRPWRTDEIFEAWQTLCMYDGRIRDGYAYIKGTIENLQLRRKQKNYNKAQGKKECSTITPATVTTLQEQDQQRKQRSSGLDLAKQLFQK